MRRLVLLSLIVVASPLLSDIVGGYFASGKMDNKQVEFKASAGDILRTPVWKSDADFPPLSARKAQDIARRKMQELLGSGKEPWRLEETSIIDLGDGAHFAYVIQFVEQPSTGCISCDFVRVLVLMDGSIPSPTIKPF